MRVVYPALLDGFACSEEDCACRRALAVAPAPAAKAYRPGEFPYREAERALLRGAARLAADQAVPEKIADIAGDYPIAAIGTPTGAELHFATLCPMVRYTLADNVDSVDLARAEGGWRVPLQVFLPADHQKTVRLTAEHVLPWRGFAAAREALLDIVADPTLSPLGRFARLVHQIDTLVAEGTLAGSVSAALPPLTPRMFLHFRAHLESRVAASDGKALGAALAKYWPLLPDLELTADSLSAVAVVLESDWHGQVQQRFAAAEEELAPAVETYLAMRVFAIPLDRDQTVQRGYAELLEAFCQALRLAAALAEVAEAPVTPAQLLGCWALCEALLADAAKPLPLFVRVDEAHGRAPRMADLDMTLAGVA